MSDKDINKKNKNLKVCIPNDISHLSYRTSMIGSSNELGQEYERQCNDWKNVNLNQESSENNSIGEFDVSAGEISNSVFYDNLKKAKLFFKYYNCKCHDCGLNVEYLPCLQLHHYGEKRYSWRQLKRMNIGVVEKILKTEEAHPLCTNCHLKQQAKKFYKFNDIIMRDGLFNYSTPELLALIDNYIDFHLDYINSSLSKKNHLKDTIKKWCKKRYIIEVFFGGKCPCCGMILTKYNLPIFIIHHLGKIEVKKNLWNSIRHLYIDQIIQIFKEQKCIMICANCHEIYHSSFSYCAEEILDKMDIEENSKLSYLETINTLYKTISYQIENFDLITYNRDYRTLFKLPIFQYDTWKENLLFLYYYMKKSCLNWFFVMNLEEIFDLPRGEGYRFISRLSEKYYIKPIDFKNSYQKRYILTEMGISKAQNLEKSLPKVSIKIKEIVSNLDYSYDPNINDKDYFSDILIKYTYYIYNLIEEKEFNEFIIPELTEKIGKDIKTVRLHIKDKLIPESLVELVDFPLITFKDKEKEVYKLTPKGFNLLEINFSDMEIDRCFHLNKRRLKNRIALYILIISNITTKRKANEFTFSDILKEIKVSDNRSSKGREAEGILLKHLRPKGYITILENPTVIKLRGRQNAYKFTDEGFKLLKYISSYLS